MTSLDMHPRLSKMMLRRMCTRALDDGWFSGGGGQGEGSAKQKNVTNNPQGTIWLYIQQGWSSNECCKQRSLNI